MLELHQPLLDVAYLRSIWAKEYELFKASPENEALFNRLKNWAQKDWQKETASEAAFIDVFFKNTWGYHASGEKGKEHGYTLWPQYPVRRAGQRGGTGEADIALGYFGREGAADVPQVLGEFKDDRSGLDKPQANRPNDRSPVEQCLDYLRESRRGTLSPPLPTWGLVTDMNEFRLYYGDKTKYQRYVIKPNEGDLAPSLLGDGDEASFQRFLFSRIFHSEWLLATSGESKLERLLGEQITHEQALEYEFYQEYHSFRESIYGALRKHNPQYEREGRLRQLVKFTQRILDRCLFILYCEDMGRELNFPPNVLRDALIGAGQNKFYDPDADNAWTEVKRLFASMRDGTPFGQERINRFNGGLFEEDAEMDALRVPNHIFCQHNQGQTSERLLQFPDTLLYFSAKYNFGTADDGGSRTLTLTAMGRIFEQSITDLEVMEAHAEGRESLTELTKRKRDGVYYTPEWVTQYIVEETVGTRLAELRQELGFDRFSDITDEQIEEHKKDQRKSKVVGAYEKALRAYGEKLDGLKVVDPACGSGAFLIQAFKYLYSQRQWIALELERVCGTMGLFDTHTAMRAVLSTNLYGVDINAESVAITRLALWLHTALPDCPLTALDRNIRCGNSLIGPDFYEQMGINRDLFGDDERERVNTFEWAEAFPEVFKDANSGFDCVIGNPPYVKLQHFRKIQEDVAVYLVQAEREDGGPLYESTQTGNFDMYLPFIERGVELLNTKGKMGYIAPNVWMVNEYGKGLRQKLKRTRSLDRWLDFKSAQVFDEAITYTALQFFTGGKHDCVRCAFAPGGKQDAASVDWRHVTDAVSYLDLPDEESWVLAPNAERKLMNRLKCECDRLGGKSVTTQIFQGLVTSADFVYHLERTGPNRYLHKPKDNGKSMEVTIEDAIMHPLVSGAEAKRYQVPNTHTCLLFPYFSTLGNPRLMKKDELLRMFPHAWNYLKSHEETLRGREQRKMDRDKDWWGYVYPKNLDKHDRDKLCVAQTVPGLRVFYDSKGAFYFNNVRVNGIIPTDAATGWFLLGVLNAPLCDYIFKRIAKPKAGGYYEANKQFIAPLPVPHASDEEKAEVGHLAKTLQELHTRRRDLMLDIDKRLTSAQCEDDIRGEEWLWADVKSIAATKKGAPRGLKGRELSAWAKSQRELTITAHLDIIDPMLRPGAQLAVTRESDELRLMVDGVPLIAGVFLDADEAEFVAAQWRQKTRHINITEKFDAKRLLGLLLKLRKTGNPAIMKQVVQLDTEIEAIDAEIAQAESDMNTLTYKLYKLTEEEIQLVEGTRST